jgi:hypothetical protein
VVEQYRGWTIEVRERVNCDGFAWLPDADPPVQMRGVISDIGEPSRERCLNAVRQAIDRHAEIQ